jgi:hypothetical protein
MWKQVALASGVQLLRSKLVAALGAWRGENVCGPQQKN